MQPSRLSLGVAFLKKRLDPTSSSRYIVHAEFDATTKKFRLTLTSYVQSRSEVSKVTKKEGICLDIVDCLEKLALAVKNASLDGFKFDLAGMRLLDAGDFDEDWTSGLLPSRKNKPVARTKNKH